MYYRHFRQKQPQRPLHVHGLHGCSLFILILYISLTCTYRIDFIYLCLLYVGYRYHKLTLMHVYILCLIQADYISLYTNSLWYHSFTSKENNRSSNTITNQSATSSPSSVSQSANQPTDCISINAVAQLPKRLTSDNYFTWRAQSLSLAFGYSRTKFIDGSYPSPSRTLPSSSSDPNHVNLAYSLWKRHFGFHHRTSCTAHSQFYHIKTSMG